MKKTNDLTILLLISSLFVVFNIAVYYIRDSAGILNNRSELGMKSYNVQPDNQESTAGNSTSVSKDSVGGDKPQKILSAKSVLSIDVLLLTGLMLGLPLIFQGRLKFIYICLAVGVFVTIIDLLIRFNFKVV